MVEVDASDVVAVSSCSFTRGSSLSLLEDRNIIEVALRSLLCGAARGEVAAPASTLLELLRGLPPFAASALLRRFVFEVNGRR